MLCASAVLLLTQQAAEAVPVEHVRFEGGFWGPRLETNRRVTIPHGWAQCEATGRLLNFAIAGGLIPGEQRSQPLDDAVVYALIEATSYALMAEPDAARDAQLDELIRWITAAAGAERGSSLVGSPALDGLGHLFAAAVAHRAATGKETLLTVAVAAGERLLATFGSGKRETWPGHHGVETGLVQLARATGHAEFAEFAQRRPNANRWVWEEVVDGKTYLTGGLAARKQDEVLGAAFDLPNATACAETCAAVANAAWNHQLFLDGGEARHLHVLERILMNGFLASVSLSGDQFFESNPLARHDDPTDPAGGGGRAPWSTAACCPVHVMRTLPAVPGMQWTVAGDVATAGLLQSGVARLRLADREIVLRMETGWPWDGRVRVIVEEVGEGAALPFTLRVRVPNGARQEPMPGGLYAYADAAEEALDADWVEERLAWSPGSSAEWEFPLPVRRVTARDEVVSCRGRVAIERGPLVYCVEAVDHEGRVEDLWLPDEAVLTPRWEPELLGGVVVLEGIGRRAARSTDGALVSADAPIRMIPYYAWANRGPGGMAVWLPRAPEPPLPPPEQTLATGARASASHGFGLDTLAALNDGRHPGSSSDQTIPRHTFWPRLGGEEWLRYDFTAPTTVATVRVYWYDDTGAGRCRVPERAQVEWLDDAGAWQPVNAFVPLGVAKDAWNEQSFAPVTTSALRLRIRLQSECSAGVLEWEVR